MEYKRIDLSQVYEGLSSHPRQEIGDERVTKHGDTPSLYCYLHDVCGEINPDRVSPAVIVCPGGAYAMTSEREAEAIALRYFAHGYQAFVLRYSASAGWPIPLCEICGAIAYLRRNAAALHVAEDKIAVLGFSAGGHLAASASTLWHLPTVSQTLGVENALCRPDASILCYPVISSGGYTHGDSMRNLLKDLADDEGMRGMMSLETQVRADTPTAFLWHTASDQAVSVMNSLLYGQALSSFDIPFEMHVFPKGPHGLASSDRDTNRLTDENTCAHVAQWMDLSIRWLDYTFQTQSMP